MAIMRRLQDLDEAILDGYYQKWSDKVDERWGVSCFRLAAYCEWLMLAILSFLCVALYFYGWGKLGIGSMFFFGTTSLLRLNRLRKYDARREEFIEDGLMNPERKFWWSGLFRVVFAILYVATGATLLVIFTLAVVIGGIPWTDGIGLFYLPIMTVSISGDYFEACTPRPRSPLRAGNDLALQALPSR